MGGHRTSGARLGEGVRSGEQTPPPAPELEESFDLISYEGNNGWARGFGADHAIREYTRRRWRHRKSAHGHHTHRAIQDFRARWGGVTGVANRVRHHLKTADNFGRVP